MKPNLVAFACAALLIASLAPADEPKEAPKPPKQAAKAPKTENSAKAAANAPGEAKVLSPPAEAAADSPLVRAAKAAKKARQAKPSSKGVITDETVKNSTGRLTVLAEAPAGEATPEEAAAVLARIEKDRTIAAARAKAAREEAEALEKEIARLEKELASIEEAYYDESDVELRADLSERDFAKTKAALAAAREKLADARKREQEFARAASNVVRP